jgi:carboxymethylenebutenolidase
MDKYKINSKIYDLYDEYYHSDMERREFLRCAAAMSVVGGISALAMTRALLPRYAQAQTISFADARIKAHYETYDSPDGTSGKMRGHLVQPSGNGLLPGERQSRGLLPWHPMAWHQLAAIPATTTTAERCRRASTAANF